MKILVVNCGSSSLKYQLLDMDAKTELAKGLLERIGIEGSELTHEAPGKDKTKLKNYVANHTEGIRLVLDTLVHPAYGVLKSMKEVDAVGHRVVHGGAKFTESALVTEEVMKAIEDCIVFGPLHNPANIAGIRACQELMPGVPQVAVFDTAFHQTMPPESFVYALPYEAYEKHGIRRYGFHGTSHCYVSRRAEEFLNKKGQDFKLITCHLGNGASLAAILNGKCIDTSMGLTPLEGLVMGTRCGSIDPDIVDFLIDKEGFTTDQMKDYMNKQSGILGISGVSSDFRDVEEAAQAGNERAKLAWNIFAHKVRKYIGAYAAIMGGVDAIVFTAGLGENSSSMRLEICKTLGFLGVSIDPEKNKKRGLENDISTDDAKCRVIVIPTNEELMIALDTQEIVAK
ncbi:MAG: acetate kinase [Peptococcaceae bacterium]|nr:acetate kinase [Peptococcaceae bacterium]